MRFAILGSRGYPSTYGGFETFVRHLAPELQRRGHEVTVYGHGLGRASRTVHENGVVSVNTPGVNQKALATLSHNLTATVAASRSGAYDAALVVNVANGFFLPLLRRRGVPVLLNVDGVEWKRAKWGSVAKAVFLAGARLSARHATELVADAQAIADIWQRDFGVRPSFIPYGATIPAVTPANGRLAELGLGSRPYVLVVARLVPENHVELTLDAFETARPDAELVVVGSANYRSPLSARLATAHGRGALKWLGHVEDQELLAELWAHAGLYVHGHSAGGTNPALLQALALGSPTLALDTPFNAEVVGAGSPALYPLDVRVLARKMSDVLAGANGVAVSKSEGVAIIEERYTWDGVVDAYENALCRLAAS